MKGKIVTVTCRNGYVHPDSKYTTIVMTCSARTPPALPEMGGVWLPSMAAGCVPVDCGEPPLGVHTLAPDVSV